MELVELILEFMPIVSPKSRHSFFRLVCRELDAKSFHWFAVQYLQTLKTNHSVDSELNIIASDCKFDEVVSLCFAIIDDTGEPVKYFEFLDDPMATISYKYTGHIFGKLSMEQAGENLLLAWSHLEQAASISTGLYSDSSLSATMAGFFQSS